MRKKPKQSRAEKTIEFISEAAIQLLDTAKTPDFTTNHIAERAGVSVGTLYRYFPDKGAILRYVVRREMNKTGNRALDLIAQSQARDAESLVHEVFEFAAGQFEGRGKVAFQAASIAIDDAQLRHEVRNMRIKIITQLHNKMMALEPSTIRALSDAELAAITDAYFAAIGSLATANDNTVNVGTRKKLALSLFEALAE